MDATENTRTRHDPLRCAVCRAICAAIVALSPALHRSPSLVEIREALSSVGIVYASHTGLSYHLRELLADDILRERPGYFYKLYVRPGTILFDPPLTVVRDVP